MRIFHYGERLRFPAKLRPPRNFRNPGAFDYEGYLAEQGIAVLGSTKAASVELLPGFAGNRMELWRTRSHRSLSEKIRTLWPPADAALIDAILIGENPILERTSQPYGKGLFYLDSQNYDRSLPPRVAQFRLDLRMISGRLERFLGVQIPRRMLFWGSRAALATFEILFISALLPSQLPTIFISQPS